MAKSTQKRSADVSSTERRQLILEFLHKRGEATAREIAEHLATPRKTVTTTLQMMRALNEIAAREVAIGRACVPHYRATVTVVVQPDASRHVSKLKPYVVNLGAQNDGPPNNPRAGGQGAVRPRTGVASCAEWI